MFFAFVALVLALTRAEIIERMKAPVVTQAEGLIQVYADCPEAMRQEFQLPIASFAVNAVKEVESGRLKAEQKRERRGKIVIHIGEERTNNTQVITRVMTNGAQVVTRIYLKAPGYSDLYRFKLEVIKGYFRAVQKEELSDDEAIARYRASNPRYRIEDERRRLEQWLNGEENVMWKCENMEMRNCGNEKMGKCENEKVGVGNEERGENVMWECGNMEMRKWGNEKLRNCGSEEVGKRGNGIVDDEEGMKLLRKVIEPGVASVRDVLTFAARLRLYPPQHDIKLPGCEQGAISLSFKEALKVCKQYPPIRLLARMKADELPVFGGGRSAEMAEAAALYRAFLMELAANERSEEELAALLDAADVKLNIAFEEAKKNEGAQ